MSTTATPTTHRNGRALHQACLVAKVCNDFRGEDTRVLDLTEVTPIFDFFVVTSGNSRRQMGAIADEADDVMAREGSDRLGTEGREAGTWILQDYGDVVLHVFDPETRKTYNLESLWADAKPVDWREVLGLPQPTAEEQRASDEAFGRTNSTFGGDDLFEAEQGIRSVDEDA